MIQSVAQFLWDGIKRTFNEVIRSYVRCGLLLVVEREMVVDAVYAMTIASIVTVVLVVVLLVVLAVCYFM